MKKERTDRINIGNNTVHEKSPVLFQEIFIIPRVLNTTGIMNIDIPPNTCATQHPSSLCDHSHIPFALTLTRLLCALC